MTHQETTPEIIRGGTVNNQEIEHIPVTPTFEIVLRIEEIPPLDVFYSPQHKAIVKYGEGKENWNSQLLPLQSMSRWMSYGKTHSQSHQSTSPGSRSS